MYTHFFKRIIDFWIALVTLILISPVLLIITILLYVFNEGAGAFFLQERPGLHGRIFKIIKFKTMNERKDASGKLLPDVQRITKFGRFVRFHPPDTKVSAVCLFRLCACTDTDLPTKSLYL